MGIAQIAQTVAATTTTGAIVTINIKQTVSYLQHPRFFSFSHI